MNKIEIVKKSVNIVVGAGASKIVHSIIKNNVEPENIIQTVNVAAGSMVLGEMVRDATKKYTDAKIDNIVDGWTKIKNKAEEAEEKKD